MNRQFQRRIERITRHFCNSLIHRGHTRPGGTKWRYVQLAPSIELAGVPRSVRLDLLPLLLALCSVVCLVFRFGLPMIRSANFNFDQLGSLNPIGNPKTDESILLVVARCASLLFSASSIATAAFLRFRRKSRTRSNGMGRYALVVSLAAIAINILDISVGVYAGA